MIEPVSEGYRYELENGGVVEVIRLLVDEKPMLGLYFKNTENKETYLGLTEEGAYALMCGLMEEFDI